MVFTVIHMYLNYFVCTFVPSYLLITLPLLMVKDRTAKHVTAYPDFMIEEGSDEHPLHRLASNFYATTDEANTLLRHRLDNCCS